MRLAGEVDHGHDRKHVDNARNENENSGCYDHRHFVLMRKTEHLNAQIEKHKRFRQQTKEREETRCEALCFVGEIPRKVVRHRDGVEERGNDARQAGRLRQHERRHRCNHHQCQLQMRLFGHVHKSKK